MHVGKNFDHFADWIEHALGLKKLSAKLRTIKDKEEYVKVILS
jgi:hypothetical protein